MDLEEQRKRQEIELKKYIPRLVNYHGASSENVAEFLRQELEGYDLPRDDDNFPVCVFARTKYAIYDNRFHLDQFTSESYLSHDTKGRDQVPRG